MVSLTATVLANSPSTAVVNEGNVTFNIIQNGQVVATVTSGTVQHGQVSATLSLAGLHAGSYSIQATYNDAGSSPNFLASQGSSTFTINRAALTVTVGNATKIYRAPNPTFTATYSGFVNGEGTANLGGSLTFSTAATTNSAVGNYAINASGYTSNDYNITYVPGTLTITYATSILNDLTQAKQGGGVLPIQLQVKDANGNNVTSSSGAVTALGISPVSASAPTMPPSSPGNSQPNNLFTYDSTTQSDFFNLKLVDGSGNALAAGTYKFYYSIAGDPITHYFLFTVK
jgi:hypothetical protein